MENVSILYLYLSRMDNATTSARGSTLVIFALTIQAKRFHQNNNIHASESKPMRHTLDAKYNL